MIAIIPEMTELAFLLPIKPMRVLPISCMVSLLYAEPFDLETAECAVEHHPGCDKEVLRMRSQRHIKRRAPIFPRENRAQAGTSYGCHGRAVVRYAGGALAGTVDTTAEMRWGG